jgi:Domain of unknown function (DUF4399)
MNLNVSTALFRAVLVYFALLANIGWAQTANAPAPKHEWLAQAPSAEAQARITNLKNGDVVESPFVVKFGMSHWGIAPAEHNHAMTGHHHLLVDTALPIPLDVPIAFSDNYRHFGKGQMEAVLDLPPGKHSLQLLLANHKHVPFFVYSSAVNVMVTRKNPNALPADYGKKPRVEILSPKDGDERSELLQVVFHASGLNVAHADTKLDGTGYFRLAIAHERKGNTERIAFSNGQTEAWLKLPKGKVRFQLEWVKNPKGDVHEVKSEWVKVNIR